jgi:hypothetical protein
MDRHLTGWKVAADNLWSADAFNVNAAALLVAQMAHESENPSLRNAAAQALPSYVRPASRAPGRGQRDLARRRFGTVRDCLHSLSAPRFGKRTDDVETAQERQYRQLMGLPLDRRLNAPEIHRAYKTTAKKMHPDVGGDERLFLELCAARDILMKNVD